jgi:DNA-binding MarR family transcriptional regulator
LFEEQVQRTLGREQVCFIEWLLLETLSELLDEDSGWVTQRMIAQRAGLSERVLSHWMSQLSAFDLVDRAPEQDSRSYAVLLTELGRRTIDACNERLEAARLTG